MNIAKDPELLRLCQRSGCVGLFMGFETFSDENLHAIGKRTNHPHEYLEVVRRIHDHGIGIDASFVFGLDGDDAGVFDRTLDRALKESFSLAGIFGRLWGTTAYKAFFYPMNLGFRQSARALRRAYAHERTHPPAGTAQPA